MKFILLLAFTIHTFPALASEYCDDTTASNIEKMYDVAELAANQYAGINKANQFALGPSTRIISNAKIYYSIPIVYTFDDGATQKILSVSTVLVKAEGCQAESANIPTSVVLH